MLLINQIERQIYLTYRLVVYSKMAAVRINYLRCYCFAKKKTNNILLIDLPGLLLFCG